MKLPWTTIIEAALAIMSLLGLTGCSTEPVQVEVKHEHKITFDRPKSDPNNPPPRILPTIIEQIKAATQQPQQSPQQKR